MHAQHRPGHADQLVICTGEFDDWKGTQLLEKAQDGTWYADVPVPYTGGAKEVKYKVRRVTAGSNVVWEV